MSGNLKSSFTVPVGWHRPLLAYHLTYQFVRTPALETWSTVQIIGKCHDPKGKMVLKEILKRQ
jgi:hypothetical protein